MKKLSMFCFLSVMNQSLYSQEPNRNFFPIWTYHHNNANIHGISLGIGTVVGKPKITNSNGIKIELIGVGLVTPFLPLSPVAQNDSEFAEVSNSPISERINGISVSLSGTACHCVTSGVSLGGVGQFNYRVNGISASFLLNFVQVHQGLQISIINESYKMTGVQIGIIGNNSNYTDGVQIGVINVSKQTRGLQIGVWNVNERRSLPIINWHFKK